jgi:hypothetical protein
MLLPQLHLVLPVLLLLLLLLHHVVAKLPTEFVFGHGRYLPKAMLLALAVSYAYQRMPAVQSGLHEGCLLSSKSMKNLVLALMLHAEAWHSWQHAPRGHQARSQ